MILESPTVKEVKKYVVDVLRKQLSDQMTYHSINHTQDVVTSAEEIAREQQLDRENIEIVQIAAWFHDTGYIRGCENHELNSAEIARTFLHKLSYPEDKIQQVEGCILATRMPQSPQNKLEQILCDADLMHLAYENYFEKATLLHQEIEVTRACKIPEDDWLKMNQEFLNNHCFFTEYAKKNYTSAVKQNLQKVRNRLKSWKKSKK